MGDKQPVNKAFVLTRPKFLDLVPGAFDGLHRKYDVFEPKMDGIWGIADIYGKTVTVYSRHGVAKARYRLGRTVKHRVVLHGEFMFGSNWGIEHKVDRWFFAFDIRQVGRMGEKEVGKMPYKERRVWLESLVREIKWPNLTVVPSFRLSQAEAKWRELVIGKGYEGLVFKDSHASFGVNWGRMKQEVTYDYVCMGFNQSDSASFKGHAVGSVKGGLNRNGKLVHVINVSGLTLELRQEFYRNPNKYVGRVFTASGKRLFKGGVLRHPNFVGWHKSKLRHECR